MPTPRYRPQRPIKPPPQRAADCPKSLADNKPLADSKPHHPKPYHPKPHHPKPQWDHDGADWPHRHSSIFVHAAGLRWHVQQMGRGPVVLLIHGTSAATHSFRGLAPLLADPPPAALRIPVALRSGQSGQ